MKLRLAALIAAALPWDGLIDHAVGEVERLEEVDIPKDQKRELAIDLLVAWADHHLDWKDLGIRKGWAVVALERYDALVLRWLLRGVVEVALRIVRRKVRRGLTGAELYAVYADHCGNKNYQGLPMPVWTELPEAIRGHWEAVAEAARRGA
jgi:hypothetical protein